jgi:hypothetical protein
MGNIGLILLVFSFVFACLAAGIPAPVGGRWHLGWLAFAFFIASLIFGSVGHLLVR